MKKLLAISTILALTAMSCQKSTTSSPAPSQQQQTTRQIAKWILPSQEIIEWSDSVTELDTTIVISLVYRTFQYMNANDSSLKKVLYTIPNNFNTISGKVKLSSTVIFYNESTNHKLNRT